MRQVTFTDTGYLVLDAELAAAHFAGLGLVAMRRDRELWLLPTRGAAGGGLILKQRNPRGDRAVLMTEVLGGDVPVGAHAAFWDPAQGALRVALVCEPATPDGQ